MKNITGFFKLLEVDGAITVEVVYEALRSPVQELHVLLYGLSAYWR